MLSLAKVNFGLNLAGLIEIICFLLAIVYFIVRLAWLAQRGTRLRGWALGLGRWGDGEMGRWGDGEMGRWGDGEMGRWGDKGNNS